MQQMIDNSVTIPNYVKTTKSYKGPIYLNKDKGYIAEYTLINYTGNSIYIQGYDGLTHKIEPVPSPNYTDSNYSPSHNERVYIKFRNILGTKTLHKENPRTEYWDGEYGEISILPSMMQNELIYCKEVNLLMSLHPIEPARHLNTKSDHKIEDFPDHLGGQLAADLFKDNLFGVVANCNDPEIQYLYIWINNKICRITIGHESGPEHISVVYTDIDGNRGVKATWEFKQLKNDLPFDLNGEDLYIASNPRDLSIMIDKYRDSGLSSTSIAKIKEDAVADMRKELEIVKQILKTKEQEYNTIVNNLKTELAYSQQQIETLEHKLFAEREYILKARKYETEDSRYATIESKLRAEEKISETKMTREQLSTMGVVLKTVSVVGPIAASVGIWAYSRLNPTTAVCCGIIRLGKLLL